MESKSCRKEENIGANIRKYLKFNKITQQSFANATGVTLRELSRIINGGYPHNRNAIFKIAKAMQVSIEELKSEDLFLSEEQLKRMVYNVKSYVKVNNLTQKEFYQKIGVNSYALWRILDRGDYPDEFFLAKIAKEMNVSEEELFNKNLFEEELKQKEESLRLLIENMTKYCKQNNITQDKFAERVGVSRYTIHKIVYGKGKPSEETIGKIKMVLES